jgi:DNA polymerase gamma 1
MPSQWKMDAPGWTRYGRDGSVTSVKDLSGETMVSFDVEVLYKLSKYPVMATAASKDAWYSWLSPQIFEDPPAAKDADDTPHEPWDMNVDKRYPHTLIPLFGGQSSPSIVVGHNVGYDRARVVDEYSLERTSTRWLDTLSLHVATRGITSVQRPAWMQHRKEKREEAAIEQDTLAALHDEAERTSDPLLAQSIAEWSASLDEADSNGVEVNTWEETTAINSLADVARLHCGTQVDKSIRDCFGDEDIKHASQLRPELEELLGYCATDVKTTHDVYKIVLPLFLTSCPHPATFAGVLSMGNSFLPVDKHWGEYLKSAEAMYQNLKEDVRLTLRALADRLRKHGETEGDPFSSQLDWTEKPARWPEGGPEAVAEPTVAEEDMLPIWYAPISANPKILVEESSWERYFIPLLLKLTYRGHPVTYLEKHKWCFRVPAADLTDYLDDCGLPVELGPNDYGYEECIGEYVYFRTIDKPGGNGRVKLTGKGCAKDIKRGLLKSEKYPTLLADLISGSIKDFVYELESIAETQSQTKKQDAWTKQLDWTLVNPDANVPKYTPGSQGLKIAKSKEAFGTWPKWYWDMTASLTSKKIAPGELDLTMRKTIAPLLLRMQWNGYPLAYSKEHKWMYRVPKSDVTEGENGSLDLDKMLKLTPVPGDEHLVDDDYVYFRLPHKDGEGHNVGNPLSKAFLKAVESGELSSGLSSDKDPQVASAAASATNMNALCSYWISSRERIMGQFVVYDEGGEQGIILPQVITMGTVTRRAVEATWLTASNAKKNRVGSELKSMIRAPPGYVIVGADVDSEELWISSVMGDSQFGIHGATAIGWMTLEGTKSAGTDLHSKTASILHISRDAAKVFNYSRIYGAGRPHAIQLLLQGDPKLTHEGADTLATKLYKQTKGLKAWRSKTLPPANSQYLWHGGSESYLFNTLESIALMDRPTTPALGCGVTRALRKSFLDAGHSYLPSRINWVVQSSGVDYLHMLIAAMEYLMNKYGIRARYLISVHDEVRYLAVEEDKNRVALALQIANAWTRALFCYNLGLDDMPQGIAFFSAVDIDHVLRKETDMPCVTPSHPTALAPGYSLDINQVLEATGGTLGPDLSPVRLPAVADPGPPVRIFDDIQSVAHTSFLKAQASTAMRNAKSYLDKLPPLPSATQPQPRKCGSKIVVNKTVANEKAAMFEHNHGQFDEPDGTINRAELRAYAEVTRAIPPAKRAVM